jgi:hypothetical protein
MKRINLNSNSCANRSLLVSKSFLRVCSKQGNNSTSSFRDYLNNL